MEEMLGNYLGAREIFKNWMTWEPGDNAWIAYSKFEERMGEFENSRSVLYQYLQCHPKLLVYIKVAKFEEKYGNLESARRLYESALAGIYLFNF